jgi:sugar/nucleoside kinase (ribokinase family)
MAEKQIELLCIGNALVDVFARLDERICVHHGITRPVQHVEIEKLQEILSEKIEFTAVSGGGAANVAKIAGLLGARVSFSGAIGAEKIRTGNQAEADHFGRLFEKSLLSAGVELKLLQKQSPTGICLILQTEEGKKRIAASPSAALEFSESDISEDEIKKAQVVVIDGFMLDRPPLVRRILNLADEYGTPAAIDLGSVAIAGKQAKEISGYAGEYSLFLFMNEDEAKAFYNGHDQSPAENKEKDTWAQRCAFFKSLTEKEKKPGARRPVIVVKQGGRGAMCFADGTSYFAETQELNPKETTGAGDAFAAAFLTGWVRQKPLPRCTALGNMAAGIVLDAAGTQAGQEAFKYLSELLVKKSGPCEPLF